MDRVIRWSLLAPRRVVGVAAAFLVCAGVFGMGVADHLSAGGFQDDSAESSRAAALLASAFDRAELQLVLTVTSDAGAQSAAARAAGTEIVRALTESPDVSDVTSAWTTSASAASTLISDDGKTGLAIAGIRGDDTHGYRQAAVLADRFTGNRDGVTIRAGGAAAAYDQINKQTQHDLLIIEAIAIPLSFLALAWVFGGLLAAALPLVVGVLAIAGALATLRTVTFFADVSTFALNITAALAMALAIDYTLLIVSRFRDQLAEGDDRTVALSRTMSTAGRTVLFSALTVASSILALLLFPMPFLRSFAYAGVAAVLFAALAAVVVAPATIMLLGERLDAYDVRRMVRRALRRPEPMPVPVHRTRWYRFTKWVMRRPVATGSGVIALLLLLGAPFLGVRWGFPDERVLPDTASARQVGDLLRSDFTADPATNLTIVVPDAGGLTPTDFADYAAAVSRVPDVASVSSPLATYIDGVVAGGPLAPSDIRDGSAYLTVRSTAEGPSASDRQLTALHAIAGPAGKPIDIGGLAQVNRDTATAITSPTSAGAGNRRAHHVRRHVPGHRQPGVTAESVGAQRIVVDRDVRRTGLGLSRRPSRRSGHQLDGSVGGERAGAAVLHRVRVVDGLRSVPDVAHPGVLAVVEPHGG